MFDKMVKGSTCVSPSHQKRAEEDEGDKVGVGDGAATFISCVPWGGVALLPSETRQHDVMPGLTCCTPARGETHKGQRGHARVV